MSNLKGRIVSNSEFKKHQEDAKKLDELKEILQPLLSKKVQLMTIKRG